jgi:hypothetical protein
MILIMRRLRMKKQILIVGIIVLFICVGLSGCTETNNLSAEEQKFVGTWTCIEGVAEGFRFTCFSDGTGISGGNSDDATFTWSLKDGKYVVDYDKVSFHNSYNYSFSNNDRQLTLATLTYGVSEIYAKQ